MTVAAAREALISAESVLAEMEAAEVDEVALICQRQNLKGAMYALVRARQDDRLYNGTGPAQKTHDWFWFVDAEIDPDYDEKPEREVRPRCGYTGCQRWSGLDADGRCGHHPLRLDGLCASCEEPLAHGQRRCNSCRNAERRAREKAAAERAADVPDWARPRHCLYGQCRSTTDLDADGRCRDHWGCTYGRCNGRNDLDSDGRCPNHPTAMDGKCYECGGPRKHGQRVCTACKQRNFKRRKAEREQPRLPAADRPRDEIKAELRRPGASTPQPKRKDAHKYKRRDDGLCRWGCGREAREKRAACPPCTEAGRKVGSCPTCDKPATGNGRVYCKVHERMAAA